MVFFWKIGLVIFVVLILISVLVLEKVIFGINWVVQVEYGGYYQVVVDGIYEVCGIEVEIKFGGLQVNNCILLLIGKIDFFMGGNMLQVFLMVEQGILIMVVVVYF